MEKLMEIATWERILKNSGRLLACLIAGMLMSLDAANGALVGSVSNGDFETTDGGVYNATTPSWDEYGGYAAGAGSWDLTGTTLFDLVPVDGVGAASLIVRPDEDGEDESWMFQSLGTIDAGDVGVPYALSADFAARDFYSGEAEGTYGADVDMTIAFRSGTTSGGVLGAALGTVGTRNIVTDNAAAELGSIVDFTSHTATFTPSAGDIGTEVFAVLSIQANSFLGGNGERQFTADNVTLSVVPEPSSLVLLAGIAVGGGLAMRRRK